MRLIKCYIENFGKLTKVDFDFSNPTILEKNGFGKTTLSNFIKSMFFGFESDNIKTRKDENNDRKKYYPWQGGAFGGNIVFEQNNKQYKIERFFGESKAKDTFILYDLSTNKESFEYTSEIGKELFGLDGESFERCLYIPQKNIEVTNTESLSTKLNSMIENTDFGVGFDIAKNNLTKVRQAYFVKGGGGLINDTNQKLIITQNTIEELKQNAKIVEGKKEEIEEKTKTLESKKEELQDVMKEISQTGDGTNQKAIIEMFSTLKEEFVKIEKQKEFIDDFFKKGKPDNEKLVKMEEQATNLEIKNKEFENVNKVLENFEHKEQRKINKTKVYFAMLPFVILLLVGAVITIFNLNLGWVICSAGFAGILVIFVCVLIPMLKNKKIEKDKVLEYTNLTTSLQSTVEEIDSCRRELDEFYNEYELIEGNYSDKMFSLKTMIRKSTEVVELYDLKKKQLQEFENTNKKILKININDIDVDNKKYEELSQRNNQLLENISILEKQIATLNSEIISLNESTQNLDYYISQADNLSEQLSEYKFKYECVENAIKFLESAKSNLDTRYLPDLKKEFINNCKQIENLSEDKISISENLELLIEENGQNRKMFYFSEGYKNLFMLCMRFALVKILYKEEKPFIILDDPFVNLDKDMFEIANSLVQKFREEYQIIYFTCHKSRDIN